MSAGYFHFSTVPDFAPGSFCGHTRSLCGIESHTKGGLENLTESDSGNIPIR